MPIYEYECTECGHIEEAVQKMSDAPLTRCKKCSGTLRKLISHSSFHLKGGGWYSDAYSSTGSSSKSSGGSSS
ncbi:MAG: zinc ribbon domain-containing protein [Desulfobacterales bacterium]|nr:zinc ribbon domain-containing protein [Desulfobacterales bacterium]